MLSVLAAFLAANALLLAVAQLYRHLLRRTPDLVARRAGVFDLSNRQDRLAAGEAELAASELEAGRLTLETERAQRRVAEQVPLSDPPSAKYGWAFVGVLLAQGEAIILTLQGTVNAVARMSAASWAFIAPLLVATVVAVLHYVFGHIITAYGRPARTIRRARGLFVLVSLVVLAGGWSLLSGRSIGDPELVEELADIGFLVLQGLLSLSAAFATIVAITLFEAENDNRHLAHLTLLHMLYTQHIQMLKKDIEQLRVETTVHPVSPLRGAPPLSPAGVVPTVMILFLFFLPSSSTAGGHQSVQSGGVPGALGMPPSARSVLEATDGSSLRFVRDGICTALVDSSASVEPEAIRPILERLAGDMAQVTDTFRCSVQRIATFAGDLFIRIQETPIPSLLDLSALCDSSRPNETKSSSRAIDFLYPRVEEARRKAAVTKCTASHKKDVDAQTARRAAAIAQVSEQLREIPLRAKGPCTALSQLVARTLLQSETTIVITDGVSTCPATTAPPSTPRGSRLVFLLVPGGSESNSMGRASGTLSRLEEVARSFPGSIVVLASEATRTFWQRLNGS